MADEFMKPLPSTTDTFIKPLSSTTDEFMKPLSSVMDEIDEIEDLDAYPLSSPLVQNVMAEKKDDTVSTNSCLLENVNKLEVSKTPQSLLATAHGTRRSSSRSIKRPKFDDELVDTSALKRSSSRKTSESSPSEIKLKKIARPISQSSSSQSQPRKKRKKFKPSPVPTDFGRWRPTDDLNLITAVQQTCDLQMVHLAMKFSCNFTLKEIQDRWFALLYDPLVSRLAQQSIKALPSDVINQTLKNALWSRDEESVLADIDSDDNPGPEEFQKSLDKHLDVFHKTRTAKTLHNHWLLLRHYQLLTCQTARNTISSSMPTTIADMETKMVNDQIAGPEDDTLNQELIMTDRCRKREIKRLAKEVTQWEVLIENSGYVEGLPTCGFGSGTLAVLKGRILNFLIKKEKVVIGRKCFDFEVDIDLSIEGPALKISRRQGVISYEDGSFHLLNCGKRPFYINGVPLLTGSSAKLIDNSIIEIYCLKLLFNINTDENRRKPGKIEE